MKAFRSTTPAVRIHAGENALDSLPHELERLNVQRVFVICGRSVATRTSLLARVQELAAHRYVGAYAALGKDAPLDDVIAAADQARALGTDALIAIGAGSVLKAVRVVAILLAESGTAKSLATQYPVDQAPISPRLLAPKVPIINIVTAATSSQHRGGAALKNSRHGPRLEFFDPKTRPTVIFWDEDALRTAPVALAQSTGLGVFWRALMNVAAVSEANPLVQASRLHAFTLARAALPKMSETHDMQARIDMCAAALLQNRDEDDGGRPLDAHWIARVVYALGAALFNHVDHLDQGTTHALLTGSALRHFGDLCPETVENIANALSLQVKKTPTYTADVGNAAAEWFGLLGLPLRLRDIGVPQYALPVVIEHALQNFNADRTRELSQHRARLNAVLNDAY